MNEKKDKRAPIKVSAADIERAYKKVQEFQRLIEKGKTPQQIFNDMLKMILIENEYTLKDNNIFRKDFNTNYDIVYKSNMKTLSIRINEKEDKELELIAKKMKTDKSTIARRAIELGIRDLKRNEAFEKIRLKEWTIWKAADYCGESYRSFLRMLREQNIPFPLSKEELKREFQENSRE
ncbi:MAG: hypothetical protein ACP6IY_17990 [Promethearchaeia archaeon]